MTIPDHPYRSLIQRVCAETPPLPPDVLEAMVWVESNFVPSAKSASNALGLGQVIYRHHAELVEKVAAELDKRGGELSLYDPEVNLRVAARYLRWCYTSDGSKSWERAVRKYHSGSADPPPGFADGQGTTSDQHIAKFRTALAAVTAARSAPPVTSRSPQPTEGTTMAVTFGRVPMFGYLDRPIIKPEGQGWNNLGQRDTLGVVLHRMLGSLWGTDSYFRQPGVNALTDFGVGVAATDGAANAGVIIRWNDPLGYRAGWASGPVSAPYGDGLLFVQKYGINAVNRRLVSLETSGNQTTPIDAVAFDEIVHFIAWHADRAGISWEDFPFYHVTGMSFLFYHDEFCFGSGKRCPFETVKALINDIIAAVKAFLKRYQTGGVSVPEPQQPKPTPVGTGGLKIGDWVAFDGEYNIRRAWDTDEYFNGEKNVVRVTAAGEKAKIIGGPNVNDGYTWWDVEIPGFGTGHVIADGMSKTDAPAPPAPPEKMWKDPAPVTELALIDPNTAGDLTISNGVNFRPVFDEVRALRQGKQRRFAIDGDNVDVIGPDYKPGDQFTAMYRFTNDAGTEYLYLSNHARVLFDDFERVSDTADLTDETADALTDALTDVLKDVGK